MLKEESPLYIPVSRLGKLVAYKFLARSFALFSNRSLYLHVCSISSDAVLILRFLRNSSLRMYHITYVQ